VDKFRKVVLKFRVRYWWRSIIWCFRLCF